MLVLKFAVNGGETKVKIFRIFQSKLSKEK